MTVKELIELLKKEDQESEVLRETEEDYKLIGSIFRESIGVILGE